MKRITVGITEKHNELIQKFRIEFINETKKDMSYTEALNWLINFGARTWFLKREDMRKKFYKVWSTSKARKKYAMDEFLEAEKGYIV